MKKEKKKKVLLLENIHANAVEEFKRNGFEVIAEKKAMTEEELMSVISDVSVLGIRSKTQVTKQVLDRAKELKVVGAFCIGTNQIDLSAAALKGVAVFNAPYSNTRSVVELVIGEIIMLLRKIPDASRDIHSGIWNKVSQESFEVRGKKLGIVGYGNIGTQLSIVAEALGMKAAFYDRQEKLALGNTKKMNSLSELLKWADIITLHVDGRKENTNYFGEKEFAQMKDGSFFLNLSRGHVLDIKALKKYLQKGKVIGASVDVYPKEPEKNGPGFVTDLQGLPNVILTPHIGGSTEEAQTAIGEFVSGKILSYLEYGSTILSVNLPGIALARKEKGITRIIHIHENVPKMLAQINSILGEKNINIAAQQLKTSESLGLVVTDVESKVTESVLSSLRNIPHTILCDSI